MALVAKRYDAARSLPNAELSQFELGVGEMRAALAMDAGLAATEALQRHKLAHIENDFKPSETNFTAVEEMTSENF